MLQRSFILLVLLATSTFSADEERRSATVIVRDALNHWRGLSSRSEMTMTIHRPDWERSMSMESWTQGEKRSLVRVTAPKKDRDNGTLIDGNKLWTYSPKINRVIQVPSSMMNQSWMGSDFSNKDISRTDDIIERYDHRLLGETNLDGLVVYEIESVPHEDAAVVWGKEVFRIREDNVMVEQRFYDQDGELIKTLRTLEVSEMGGRTVAAQQRMEKTDTPDEWTEIRLDSISFDVELGDSVFTLSNLRNPRN
ncbi:MAG: outer membrane lipoprotein-sorting protein [Proteobacteria bacterium]|nr:outer membrane lipoprotein-sorting protein [Pseudomonadota bacterium]MDA0993020.1 outer membrane lipoprotein-sorting protein [Pseudomonadota bacterium]